MLMRAMGPAAGWSWLVQGFGVYRRAPGTMLGASALLVLCTAIMLGVQMLVQHVGGARRSALFMGMGGAVVIFGIVFPILIGGFMRVVHASREGGVARARMVLQPFQPGQGGGRLALFGVCMLVLYVAFLALVLGTMGRELVRWYADLVAAQSAGVPAQALSPLPAGSALPLTLLTVFLIFYSAATAIGIGQVSLRGRPPLPAFRDGLAGAFKNVLPLLVLTVSGLVVLVLALLVVGILTAILVLLGSLLGHVLGSGAAGIGLALVAVVEIAFVLAAYPVAVGVQVALWHDVTGGVEGNPEPAPTSGMTA